MKGKIVVVELNARVSEKDKVQILMSLAQSLSDRDADKTARLLNRAGLLAVINRLLPLNEIRVADKEQTRRLTLTS